MAGDAETAIAAAEQLPTVTSKEVSATVPWVQLIDAAPYFAHAQFSDPETTLGLPDPGEDPAYVKAMWHYARGAAYAGQKAIESARAEGDTIGTIARKHDFQDMVEGGVPAPQLLELAQLVMSGRVAQAQGNFQAAVMSFQKAAAIQDGLPYLEPPYWYHPAKQSVGAALLQQGTPNEAEQVFRNTLEQFPNNAWALYGL